MKCDFHTHILPSIDDGPDDPRESIEMLRKLQKDGVGLVAATPHFDASIFSVERFAERRARALEKVTAAAEDEPLPQIVLGAEVRLGPGVWELPDLKPLCLAGTDYILLELPFAELGASFTRNLYNLTVTHGVYPILAHIERYLPYLDYSDIGSLISLGALCQINLGALLSFSERRKVSHLIYGGMAHLLGTDAHDMTRRPPRFAEASDVIRRKYGPRVLERFDENAQKVLENRHVQEILG